MAEIVATVDNVNKVHVGTGVGGVDAFTSPQRVDINASSSGNNTVVSAVANKKIRVLQFLMVCAGSVNCTWESSGGSTLSGPLPFAANGGTAPPYCPVGHFETVTGEGLVLNLGSAVQVGGHLVYVTV